MSDVKIDQEKLVAFADMIEGILQRKKDAAAEEKEAYDGFVAENPGTKKKNIKKAVKEYFIWVKNSEEFNSDEFEKNVLLDILTGEKCITEPAPAE
jgi:hypothetical protein